jgi:hypothetical protein
MTDMPDQKNHVNLTAILPIVLRITHPAAENNDLSLTLTPSS